MSTSKFYYLPVSIAVPDSPQNLTINYLLNNGIAVSWSSVISAEFYKVQVQHRFNNSLVQSSNSPDNVTNTDTVIMGLTPGGLYKVVVSAVNEAGEGDKAQINSTTRRVFQLCY